MLLTQPYYPPKPLYELATVAQLKSILRGREVECKGCSEKHEFIKRVKDTDHMEDL